MSSRKRIELTKRDEELFKYLFANKGATLKQIHRDLFPEATERLVYRRTQKLRDYGLINTNVYFEKIQYGVFSVSKKGLNEVYDLEEDLLSCELLSGNIKHDKVLLDLKNILTKVHCFDFYASENEIESGLVESKVYPVEACKELHSDALLGIKFNDRHINFAIEYENSEKSNNRYSEYLKNYYAYPIVDHVIYFAKNEKIKRRIINADKKIIENMSDQSSKVFVTNIEELNESFKNLKTYNASKDFLEFKWSKEMSI